MVRSILTINNNSFATCSYDNSIKLFNIIEDRMNCYATLTGHTDTIYSLILLKDNTLVSSSDDNAIRLWDINNKICINTLECISTPYALYETNDNNLISGHIDGSIIVWNRNINNYNQHIIYKI